MCIMLRSGPFFTSGGTMGVPCFGLLCTKVQVLAKPLCEVGPGTQGLHKQTDHLDIVPAVGAGGIWMDQHLQQCSASHRQTCLPWSKPWQHNLKLYAPWCEIQPCFKFHSLSLQVPKRIHPVPQHIGNMGTTSSSSLTSALAGD